MSRNHPTPLTLSSAAESSLFNIGILGVCRVDSPLSGVKLSLTFTSDFFLRKERVDGHIKFLDPPSLFQLQMNARPAARLGVKSGPSAAKEQK